MRIGWTAGGATDTGRVRPNNEDALLSDPAHGLFLVADGMGGHAAGEVASRLAVEACARGVRRKGTGAAPVEALREGFRAAREALAECCANDPRTRGMGTTLTVLLLRPDGEYGIGHIGDSRAYLLRDGRLEQLTRDHTWVQEQVEKGSLSARAARTHPYAHIITRALGVDSADEPELSGGRTAPGDLFLLVTDGVTGKLEDGQIARMLAPGPLDAAAAALVEEANRRGGEDNATVALVGVRAVEGEV